MNCLECLEEETNFMKIEDEICTEGWARKLSKINRIFYSVILFICTFSVFKILFSFYLVFLFEMNHGRKVRNNNVLISTNI